MAKKKLATEKHTRSPLASEGNCLTAFDGKIGVACLEPEPAPRFWDDVVPVMDGDEMDANARRLAAAWNACSTLSTASLESGAVAALLAACEGALTCLEQQGHDTGMGGPLSDLRDALAQARGE